MVDFIAKRPGALPLDNYRQRQVLQFLYCLSETFTIKINKNDVSSKDEMDRETRIHPLGLSPGDGAQ